jgi:hypothetical protein
VKRGQRDRHRRLCGMENTEKEKLFGRENLLGK